MEDNDESLPFGAPGKRQRHRAARAIQKIVRAFTARRRFGRLKQVFWHDNNHMVAHITLKAFRRIVVFFWLLCACSELFEVIWVVVMPESISDSVLWRP
jgi:hypothetical protein